tara:strand:- start:574 stop:945 length:372 start_codon:yes stop_codon:yes gene_type:complete
MAPRSKAPSDSDGKSKKESTGDVDPSMDESDDMEDKLIVGAIKTYLENHKERKRVNQDNIEMLTTILEEYLQSFLIIGYNYDGEVVTSTSAQNQVQVDALNTGILRYIGQHMARDIPPPPPPW